MHLYPVAEEHDVDQGGEFPEEPLPDDDAEEGHRTIDVGDSDRDGDEHHHPGHPCPEFAYDAGEGRPAAVKVYHGRKSEEEVVRAREPYEDPEEFLDRTREEEDRDGKNGRGDEPPPEVLKSVVLVLPRLPPGPLPQVASRAPYGRGS